MPQSFRTTQSRPTVQLLEDRSTPTSTLPPGLLQGTVFADLGGDGRRHPGDAGLGGVTVALDINRDGSTDAVTTTRADGGYEFSAVPDGEHYVSAPPPVGFRASTPNPTMVVLIGGSVLEPPTTADYPSPPSPRDLGLTPITGIGGRVAFLDATPELQRPGLAGMTVAFDAGNDGVGLITTTTDRDGYYFFANVPAGTHRITLEAPPGSKIVNTPLGDNAWVTDVTDGIVTGKNFGVTFPGSVTGRLFLDTNGNGTRDGGERDVRPGSVQVRLDDASSVAPVPWTVNSEGTFTLRGLPDGTHSVILAPPGGLALTKDAAITVRIADGSGTIPDLAVRRANGSTVAIGDANGGGAVVYSFITTDKGVLIGTPGKAVGGGSKSESRVVLADVTGDGTDDLLIATGRGDAPVLRMFDGASKVELIAGGVEVFERSFLGGVNLAAGDFNGDGQADVVVTADTGGGARVRVLDSARLLAGNSADASVLADFLGIADTKFRGGARAAVGDLNGDGVVDLVVAAGSGGGPRVAIFNGRSVLVNTPERVVGDFFVFESRLRDGAVVGIGDVDGDGKFDLVASAGPGGAPRVSVLAGNEVVAGRAADSRRIADFFVAGDTRSRAGSRVTVKDVDHDGRADLIAASGGKAYVFTGRGLINAPSNPTAGGELLPFASNGLFVG